MKKCPSTYNIITDTKNRLIH